MIDNKILSLFSNSDTTNNVAKINSTTERIFKQINIYFTPILIIATLVLLIISIVFIFMMGIKPNEAQKYKDKLKYTIFSAIGLGMIVMIILPILIGFLLPGGDTSTAIPTG
ncbi:DUF1980 domain-containing protein [Mesomycoplasma lagogenitalium]|uniref:DUF1980 domain-containing protein n=1 Tax=Mesomycoplasma lagogenitalium TaxID=171286 RepID=A0ABY8LTD0_9BACT|nr:DUF1980 domain-containing protein [Mesomycoplasma lagogenitalium]WGI36501.1 hypothetical protein QEG99_03485 [Mesomycoplasma lagogenitalium]